MNIAFAGLRHAHIFGLYEKAKITPGVSVTGAWEEDPAARAQAQKVVGEPFYDHFDDLLGDPKVDAVAVGDYYGVRGARVLRALEAGKAIIADKPLCTSLDELAAIRALALQKRLNVTCMLDLRYDPAVRMARRLVREGRLGRVHAMNFTGQHPLDWGTRPMWYFEAGKHGGTINDIAIHGIDALRFVTGLAFRRPVTAPSSWPNSRAGRGSSRTCPTPPRASPPGECPATGASTSGAKRPPWNSATAAARCCWPKGAKTPFRKSPARRRRIPGSPTS